MVNGLAESGAGRDEINGALCLGEGLMYGQLAKFLKMAAIVAVASGLAGCAPGPSDDPLEPLNRGMHGVNVALDTVALRPGSQVYGAIVPQPARSGVNNFANNLSLPGAVVNDLLQLRLEDALHNTTRFVVNTTVGLGGLLDPATAAGVEARPSDFGETLHVWGFGEGAYVELPVFGPSTTRDTIGLLVDTVLNPVNQVATAQQMNVILGVQTAKRLDDRYSFGATVDSILYDSADGYAQARLLYLQNRRFQLGDTAQDEEELYDLYEETFE